MREVKFGVFSIVAVVAMLAICLSGCSTAPIKFSEGMPIPLDRIYNTNYIEYIEGYELVTFTRDLGFLGGGCSHTVFIDNDKAFALQPGESIATYLPCGNHYFRLELGAGLCPNEVHSQSTFLVKDTPQAYRVSISGGSSTMFTRIK